MGIIEQNNFDNNFYENIGFDKNCWTNTIKPNNVIYIFTKNYIGEDDEIGHKALEDFINTLPELETIPKILVFWCNSVELCIEGSNLLDSLKKVEKFGTKILVSSQALLSKNLQNLLKIGRIANNLDLIHAINSTPKIVSL